MLNFNGDHSDMPVHKTLERDYPQSTQLKLGDFQTPLPLGMLSNNRMTSKQ